MPRLGSDGARPSAVVAALAELRARMGADLVWFGRLADVNAGKTPQRLWWSGLWADGHADAGQALRLLEDRPVSVAAQVNLVAPALAWQTRTYAHETKGFWSQSFARDVYLHHHLHEEHRLLVRDDNGALGIVAAVWDRRRTGVSTRLSRALRDSHARWVHDRLRQALQVRPPSAAAPQGHFVFSPAAGLQLASPAAYRWLNAQRTARLLSGVERATRQDTGQPLAIIAAEAEVRLTPLDGPLGKAWLGELAAPSHPSLAARPTLTPTQALVVARVLAGGTAAEIAGELNKSVETVRSQIKQAYARLGVTNRLDLARAMSALPR